MLKIAFLAGLITIFVKSQSQVIVDSSSSREFKSVLIQHTKLTYHYYICGDSLAEFFFKNYVAECIKKSSQKLIPKTELDISNYHCTIYDSVLLRKVCDTVIGMGLKGKQSVLTFNFINNLSQKLIYAFVMKTKKANQISRRRKVRNKYSVQPDGVFKDNNKNHNVERYILKRILATRNESGMITVAIW
jgi:uncharacterized FAD-dependent dehydrogenase